MTEPQYDLLASPLFRIRSVHGGVSEASLPRVLTLLSCTEVAGFAALQPHQRQPWYTFLVQLAALALHGTQAAAEDLDEPMWKERLLSLSAGNAAAWALIVRDLDQPAFMQPPVPEGTLDGFRTKAAQPDAVDVLVTTKNHDVKSARIARPAPEHWVFTLATLQTMHGYSGRDNYGIVRMNGGFGNRPLVGLAPDPGWSARFRRDVRMLLETRSRLCEEYGYPEKDGAALLWLLPWDGRESLALQACDPFFIEICRRVRLIEEDSQIRARLAPTKAKRIAAALDVGDTGDPWTPRKSATGEALTLDRSGFTYRRLQRLLLSGEFSPGAAAVPFPFDPPAVFVVAQGMVRGQGKTEGLHERVIPVPKSIRGRLGDPQGREKLHALSARRVEAVRLVDRSILHPALCALLQGGPDALKLDDSRTRHWRDAFDAMVDHVFFDHLWADADLDFETADLHWAELLRELARAQLDDALRSAPIPKARWYRAAAAAERAFDGAFHNRFPDLSPSAERSNDEDVAAV